MAVPYTQHVPPPLVDSRLRVSDIERMAKAGVTIAYRDIAGAVIPDNQLTPAPYPTLADAFGIAGTGRVDRTETTLKS